MKNKIVAGILAILLGWLGLHKFYLGKWVQGIIYILFMLTAIPAMISIFEGIWYLIITKDQFDIEFNAEYIRNKEIIENNKK